MSDEKRSFEGLDLSKDVYNREYWEEGQNHDWGGYASDGFGGYRDFPVHWITTEKLVNHIRVHAPKTEYVIEVGPARGYIGWRLEAFGYKYTGLEVSEHCWHTRAVEDIRLHNVEEFPWPIDESIPRDHRFVFSIAVLEHITTPSLQAFAAELDRVAPQGLHGITVDHDPNDIDKTHDAGTIIPIPEWRKVLPDGHVAVDKEELERTTAPIQLGPGAPGIKLNLGSFTVMWHYGWEHLDIAPLQNYAEAYSYKFRQHDLTQPLPYEDGTVRFITFHHALEHFPYDVGLKILKECYRVLHPGGVIRVSVPDAAKITKAYVDGTIGQWDQVSAGGAKSQGAKKLWEILMSGHHSTYDAGDLERALKQAGFDLVLIQLFRRSVSPSIVEETLDSFPSLSLFAEAIK